jgi:tripartite-type tricarboxylate transporter receptor subunit TctC
MRQNMLLVALAGEHAGGTRRLCEEAAAGLCPRRARQRRPSRDGNISAPSPVSRPYRCAIAGNAPLVVDLLAGQVKAGFVATAGVIQRVRDGKLKGLAISSSTRSPLAPNVPTTAEAGYPDFKLGSYFVLLGPAGLPDAIADLLEREVRTALKSPDLHDKFTAQDIATVGSSAAEAREFLHADTALWARLAKDANLRVD